MAAAGDPGTHDRFCTRCGAQLAESVRFCTSCGAEVAPQSSPLRQEPDSVEVPSEPNADPQDAVLPVPEPAVRARRTFSRRWVVAALVGVAVIAGSLAAFTLLREPSTPPSPSVDGSGSDQTAETATDSTYEEAVEIAGQDLTRIATAMIALEEQAASKGLGYWDYADSEEYMSFLRQGWSAGAVFGEAVSRQETGTGEIDSLSECAAGTASWNNKGLGSGYTPDLYGNFQNGCRVWLWQEGRAPMPSGDLEPTPDIDT